MVRCMVYEEPKLGKSNVDMLVKYVEALTPPDNTPTPDTPAEAYRAGFTAARAATRRLVIDMWNAAEMVHMAGNDIYGGEDDIYGD